MKPIRVLLQTTIPKVDDDWHVGRFSLLARELSATADGTRTVDVVARDRASKADDSILSRLHESTFDQIWLMAVDVGDGLTEKELDSLRRFRERGGGVFTARDHQDLGSCLARLPGPGRANYFRSVNQNPVNDCRQDDDCFTKNVSWPNYHSGKNGDVQTIEATSPKHPLLLREDGSTLRLFPAHPHEGDIGVPDDEPARVVATGRSKVTGKEFNLLVAFEGARLGRAVVASSFHHLVDYNWNPILGAPSFVDDPLGNDVRSNPALLGDVKQFVRNAALWLSP